MKTPASTPRRPARHVVRLAALLGLTAAALPFRAAATTYNWVGGGGNSMSAAGNWQSLTTPVSDQDTALTFGQSLSRAPNQNITDAATAFRLNALNFTNAAGAYTLVGNDYEFVNTRAGAGPAITHGSASDISIANNLKLTNSLTVQGTGTGGLTLSGSLSGAGGLTKSSAGTLTLTGANTYTGTTTISTGTLQVGNGGTSGSLGGNGGIVNNAALVFNRSDDLTVGNAISGTGSLTKNGGGTLTLSGANSYTGLTTVNAGTLAVTGTLTGGGSLNVVAAAVALNGTGTITTSATRVGTSGVGTFTQNDTSTHATGSLILGLGSSGNGTYNLNGGTLQTSTVTGGAGTGTFNFNGGTLRATGDTTTFFGALTAANVQAGGARIDTQGYNVTVYQNLQSGVTGSGNFDGGLTKLGSGTLTLSSPNTYSGKTTVNAGTLAVSGSGSLTGYLLNVSAGATLAVSGSGTVHPADGLQLAGTASQPAIATLADTGTLQLDGGAGQPSSVIGFGGYGSLLQNGGSVLVNAGLVIGNSTGGSGTYTMNAGNLSASAGTLTIGIFKASGTLTQNGGTIAANMIKLGSTSGSVGVYNLNGGTLTVGTSVTGSMGTSTFNFNGGTLQSAANTAIAVQGLTAANVQAGGANIDTNSGSVAVTQALLHDPALGAARDGGLTKLGAGTLTLNRASTYTGGTTVQGGTLVAGANGALGSGDVNVQLTCVSLTLATGVTDAIADTARLTLAGGGTPGVADAGYLDLNGNTETVGSLVLGTTLYTSGTFTSALFPEYFSGAGMLLVGAVPEPSTWAMLGIGTLGLGFALRRRAARAA